MKMEVGTARSFRRWMARVVSPTGTVIRGPGELTGESTVPNVPSVYAS